MGSITAEPASVSTTLNYFSLPADGSKPLTYISDDPSNPDRPRRNYDLIPRPRDITNLRSSIQKTSLDTHGFEFVSAPAKHTAFDSDAAIEAEYYAESVELLKKHTGATRAVIFDHTIRRRKPGVPDLPDSRQPVPLVHVDQTPRSAANRVIRHTGEAKLLNTRFQIINLWRPISGKTAWDHPLALCDWRTLDFENDLVPTTLRYPDRDGEVFSVKWNERHTWYYTRGMKPDEVVFIKCYDNKRDGSTAVLTPHTAFEDPTTPQDAPFRESIELRALVFYEDDDKDLESPQADEVA